MMNRPLVKSESHYDNKWPYLRTILLKVLKQESIKKQEWYNLFSGVHDIVLWDDNIGATKIYESLHQEITSFIKISQARVLARGDEMALLKTYIIEWRKFSRQTLYVPLPFRHLESRMGNMYALNYTLNTNTLEKPDESESLIRKMMLNLWNKSIFNGIKHQLRDSAMKLIHSERIGDSVNQHLVIGVRESYVNLYVDKERNLESYRDNFESSYLEETIEFYRLRASEYLQANGVHSFLRYADAKLREEEARAKRYLEPSSFNELTSCCVSVLIDDTLPIILAECGPLIKAEDIERLQLMFRLLNRVADGVEPMLDDLESHIVSSGLADMISAAETITQDSVKYVERLLELFRRFSKLVKEAFNDDPRFLTVRDKAFKTVVNDVSVFKIELPTSLSARYNRLAPPESKCPELLANYCDMLLRKTSLNKRLTGDEIESRLEDVVMILKYITNRDVFMLYHKAHLTRRLILNSSSDSEREEDIVESLRDVGMPADYVNKLSIMFQDIKVSEDINAQFHSSTDRHDTINIKILNAGAWAQWERVSVTLPLELEDYIPEVEEFYKKAHSGRKLQWYHHMSNGTITFANKVGKFDFDVTTFQMAVLFAWNERPQEKVSYEDLRLATELPDPELRRTLWSLVAFPKLKRQPLLMEPVVLSPKDFTDSTSFWVNQEFAIIKNGKVQRRGKMNLIGRLQLSTDRSQKEDNDSIVQLRILRTQEAIIKVMKMRKRLDFTALQTELIAILRNMFFPSKKLIKEQLEWLIEYHYLRRDEDEMNTFIYMV